MKAGNQFKLCALGASLLPAASSVAFAFHDACPQDIILGIDFLTVHSALINCSAGILRLELTFCSSYVRSIIGTVREVFKLPATTDAVSKATTGAVSAPFARLFTNN